MVFKSLIRVDQDECLNTLSLKLLKQIILWASIKLKSDFSTFHIMFDLADILINNYYIPNNILNTKVLLKQSRINNNEQ